MSDLAIGERKEVSKGRRKAFAVFSTGIIEGEIVGERCWPNCAKQFSFVFDGRQVWLSSLNVFDSRDAAQEYWDSKFSS